MCGIKGVSWLALCARRRELEMWLHDNRSDHPSYQDHCTAYATVLAEIEDRKMAAVGELAIDDEI